jgi:hypothetical protein
MADNDDMRSTDMLGGLGGWFGVGGQTWDTGGVYSSTGGNAGVPYNTGGTSAAGTFGAGGIIAAGGAFTTGGDAGFGGSFDTGGDTGMAGSFGTGGDIGVAGSFGTGGDIGVAGSFNTGGVGVAGSFGTGGVGVAGSFNTGGVGIAGSSNTGGTSTGTGGSAGNGGGTGTCCPSGDCLCHGPAPTALTSAAGPFKTATFTIAAGTVHYPTDAEPPFAGVSICPGFLNSGPEMAPWGPFYASHGIVTVVTNTIGSDIPDIRATKLLAAITQLKSENTRTDSPLLGKLAGRYGTSGYSMGGGGTTIASSRDSTLLTSVGLAAWGGIGTGVSVATLLLCGTSDTVAPCSMSQTVYTQLSGSTDKMMIQIPLATHFNWFGPADAGGGMSGKYALAFQKVFLEGDERWRPLLLQQPAGAARSTNIQ